MILKLPPRYKRNSLHRKEREREIGELPAIHPERIIDRCYYTSNIILFREPYRRAATRFRGKSHQFSLAFIRITPDTSDSYNRVQSGFYPASIPYTLVPTRFFFRRFSAAKNGLQQLFLFFRARDVGDVSPGH